MPRKKLTIQDQAELLEIITDIVGEEFILHGSAAMSFYGAGRSSLDVDLIDRGPVTESTVFRKLKLAGFDPYQVLDTEEGKVYRLKFDGWLVDVHLVDSALYNKLKRRASFVTWSGKGFYVIAPEDLIELKTLRSSPQDIVDIQQILFIIERENDD